MGGGMHGGEGGLPVGAVPGRVEGVPLRHVTPTGATTERNEPPALGCPVPAGGSFVRLWAGCSAWERFREHVSRCQRVLRKNGPLSR